MALPFKALAVFAGVLAAAGVFTASSLSMTAGMVSAAAVSAPAASKPLKPSYVARMPVAGAATLDIARSVPVKPMMPAVPVLPPAAATTAVAAIEVEATPSYSHQVSATGAKVRTGPKKSFPQVFTLRQGSWVNISENVRGWVKVTDEDGREGWVYGSLLAPDATAFEVAATVQ